MNYSREKIEKEYEEIYSSSERISRKFLAYLVRALFFALIALVVVSICAGVGMVRGIIDDTPDVDSINISPSGFATIIYDADGNELQKLVSPNSNRMAVSIDKVPAVLQQAVIAIEDERFYSHNGIDPRGIVRAFVYSISHHFRETQGASTITQQLLKNNVFTNWTQETGMIAHIRRKLQEQYLAIQLEKKLNNKDLILENYLNTINLGAGTYGVEAASKKYFNKDVWDLTLSEATVLAGITQNPYKYNPIRFPEKNAEKREIVLDKMVQLGYISEEEKTEVLADNVYERIQAAQQTAKAQNAVYSYFVDELTDQIITDLMEIRGYTETQAYQLLYSGGLRIFTTQDQEIQKICDEEFLNEANYPNATEYELDWALTITNEAGETVNFDRNMLAEYFQKEDEEFDLKFTTISEAQNYVTRYKKAILSDSDKIVKETVSYVPQPQASIVVMDHTNGYVKALVGGRGEKAASLTLNRATNTYRQPGSTFKILAAYAPALESGRISLATIFMDEPYNYADGSAVHDWITEDYLGNITVREAIACSVNVPAVKCLTEITPRVGYEQLLKFGFTTLSEENDIYQPLALGGIYNGVSVLELTAAYAAIANEGEYIRPIFYTKILDQFGNTIIDNTPEASRAISETTAFLLTSAMETVVEKGTGMACALPNMPVAGKTGTTSDYRNLWFAGFTPYYTCGVWAGYDDGRKLPDEGTYHDYHKTLWQAVMKRIHEDLPYREFTIPNGIVQATVCESTCLLSTDNCFKPITEYFSIETVPYATCEKHRLGTVDAVDYSYYRGYPSGGNSTEPGAYAMGVNDLYLFSLEDMERMYGDYLEERAEQLRALEEERRRKEEEERLAEEERKRQEAEAAARAAEEAARAESERARSESEAAAASESEDTASESSETEGDDTGGDTTGGDDNADMGGDAETHEGDEGGE